MIANESVGASRLDSGRRAIAGGITDGSCDSSRAAHQHVRAALARS
ncbi:hypothetical protein MYA_3941 [Burkholderia sp. KJ006]|nr:hypothetical protein MYA_3941 [Burkholderia sp. KJ006]